MSITLLFAIIFNHSSSTYLGRPIPYDPDVTTDQLAQKVKYEIEHMIETHQRRPGNITQAFLDRFISSSTSNS